MPNASDGPPATQRAPAPALATNVPAPDCNVIDTESGSALALGRGIGDRSSEQPLSDAHLQAPKRNAQRRQPDAARTRQSYAGSDQDDATDRELEAAIEM